MTLFEQIKQEPNSTITRRLFADIIECKKETETFDEIYNLICDRVKEKKIKTTHELNEIIKTTNQELTNGEIIDEKQENIIIEEQESSTDDKESIPKIKGAIADLCNDSENVCDYLFANYEKSKPELIKFFDKIKKTTIKKLIKNIEVSSCEQIFFRRMLMGDKRFINYRVKQLEKKKKTDWVDTDACDELIENTKKMEFTKDEKEKYIIEFYKKINTLTGNRSNTLNKDYNNKHKKYKDGISGIKERFRKYKDSKFPITANEVSIKPSDFIMELKTLFKNNKVKGK